MANTRTVECRHGIFTFHSEDKFLGTSLRLYGEYSEGEVEMYDAFLKPTDVAIEVGANIGALTVPLAQRCKRVFAFEPQPESFTLLTMNLSHNAISNADALPYAVGDEKKMVSIPSIAEIDNNYGRVEVGSGRWPVEQVILDGMGFGKIDFIKMDCEGMELEVLRGADRLITTHAPLMYIENDRPDNSDALVGWLMDHGYHCFWHRPRLYRENNYRNYVDNIFGVSDSTNMICVREFDSSNPWLQDKVDDPR